MLNDVQVKELTSIAKDLRKDVLDMVYTAKSGHLGGTFSSVDIVTELFFNQMKIDPKNPKWESRDRFIASKGHCAPVIYAALAKLGYFSVNNLKDLRKLNSMLQGHPVMKKTPGIDMTTGSLGQGLSAGIGMSLAGKLSGDNFYVYVLLGDGELDEGQVWEAAMSAAKFKVNNLIAICDRNGLQIDGSTEQVMPLEKIADKWRTFRWNVIIADGHSFAILDDSINKAKQQTTKPSIIIAKTIKGKGVSFMENNAAWHGKCPDDIEYQNAKSELLKG